MLEIDPIFKKQILALSMRAENKNMHTFSEFLTLNEQAALSVLGIQNVCLWGGIEDCERKIARFGDPDFTEYEEAFPITCVRIEPRSKNYADSFTHRDFLGAIINLGIRRSVIGDIFILDNSAYVFCTPPMANFIVDNLERVKHTFVRGAICQEIPSQLKSKTTNMRVNVASERADAVAAAVFNLSRGESARYFNGQRVFINDALCENGSKILSAQDRVTLRGLGKFIYRGIQTETKKGRYFIEVDLYGN